MASTSIDLGDRMGPLGNRTDSGWVRGLGKLFRRVALFRVEGVRARVSAVHGMGPPPLGAGISLLEPTPLRWAVEAASPVIGAGAGPGGALVAASLGLSAPRAYAVIPLALQGRLTALAYVDQASEPLPLAAAGDLFSFCSRVLSGAPLGRSPARIRSAIRSTRRRYRGRTVRRPEPTCAPAPRPVPEAGADSAIIAPERESESVTRQPPGRRVEEGAPLAALAPERESESVTRQPPGRRLEKKPLIAAFAPEREPESVARRRNRRIAQRALVAVVAMVLLGLALLLPLAPPAGGGAEKLVQIPRAAGVTAIARHLQASGLIRSAFAFELAARLSGVDRSLKAGAYHLPQGAWAWSVLASLHRGQVHLRTVTVPEGLTLPEVASLLELRGLARATDILREAHEPSLLRRHGIEAPSAEGFLFPETYTMARGLTAREILGIMLDEFQARMRELPGVAALPPGKLFRVVTLASLVEREARDPSELARVAGVFQNRLARGMRLESCATVQYVLGTPKKQLGLADVRQPSPYNTYLHPGLPPGPIANPGLDAIAAAFTPEKHDYLFFFARDDGTHRHVFSKTYAEHMRRQTTMRGR